MRSVVEVAKQRFHAFADHMRENGHSDAKVSRDPDRRRTYVYCWAPECRGDPEAQWIFTDCALRETPHILEYFRQSGMADLAEEVLKAKPVPGAWGKVLLEFLGDDPL